MVKILPEKVPQKIKIRITDINNNDLQVFERFTATVTFNPLDGYKSSSYSEGIYAGGYLEEDVVKLGKNPPVYAVFYNLREHINSLIYDNINYDEAVVASAVLLGDRSRLESDFYRDSKITGITHMLVVSGTHFGILFELLCGALVLFKTPKRFNSLVLMLSVLVVIAVCGFTPSIMRAGSTYFIIALGMFLRLKPDALNSLGVAATAITFMSPFSAGNISFLLSFLSTFGLIYVCPIIYKKLLEFISKIYKPRTVLRAVLFSLCQTLSATVFVMPVSILSFGYVSAVSLICNLLTGYAMVLVMILTVGGVLCLSLPFAFKAAATVFTVPLCRLVRYVKGVVSFFAEMNAPILATNKLYIIPVVLMIFSIIIYVIINNDRISYRLKRSFKIVSSILLSAFILCFTAFYCLLPAEKVMAVDVGEGSCILVSYNNTVIAIGAGDGKSDSEKITNSLLEMGETKIDYIVLPCLDKNIAGGAAALVSSFPETAVILPADGGCIDEMEYISSDKFVFFDSSCRTFDSQGCELLIYKDNGVIINFSGLSLVIYSGGDLSDIVANCGSDEIYVFCAGSVPENISSIGAEKVVLTGETEKIKEFLNNQTEYYVNTFTGSVVFGGAV